MALNATLVWEIRTTGAQTNGGGYKPGASGTDYSQQAAAQYALTTVTSAGATATMTHASAAAVMVGNTCRVVSGTNATLGWYEIISVNVGVDITVDRNWCTGAVTNGAVNVGGAFKIGGTLDNDFFEAKVAGNTIWIGPGTHTTGEGMTPTPAGTSAAPINVKGYNAARDDAPTGDNRPLINVGTSYWNDSGGYRNYSYLRFTGSGSQHPFYTASNSTVSNCKGTYTGTSANVVALSFSGVSGTTFINCEASSPTGYAFGNAAYLVNCYAHDSKVGINRPGIVTGCVIDTCQTGIDIATDVTSCYNNTVRNCLLGIEAGGTDSGFFINNIIADCVTGASLAAVENQYWDYNCWSNNDTDVTNVTKGSHDVTADALLGSGIAEGTDGVTNAAPGTTFTAASNPFGSVTTSDYLNIIEAGTGATLGVYAISAVVGAGTLTLATSPGASKTGIDYRIVLGKDFTLGAGSPAFNAGLKLGADVGL